MASANAQSVGPQDLLGEARLRESELQLQERVAGQEALLGQPLHPGPQRPDLRRRPAQHQQQTQVQPQAEAAARAQPGVAFPRQEVRVLALQIQR